MATAGGRSPRSRPGTSSAGSTRWWRTGPANQANYSGTHKAHSLLFLALADDVGKLA
jgi:hypothetical protein